MNERIRELIEQAGCSVDGMGYGEGNIEKFAELIVRECLGKVAEAAHARRDPFFAYSQILEHFGVEE
jgi:hypothetical protein